MVSVDDDHSGDLPAVVERLRAAGMEVDQALDSIGTVTGSVDAGRAPAVAEVKGVAGVETSREFRLPPPDAPVQ